MTEANPLLKEIWKEDRLRRWKDAEFLERFLVARTEKRKATGKPGAYVLELDADWGAGKTFFMKRFAEQLRLSGHLVAEINAWKDDATDDPFVAVLAAIDTVFKPFKEKEAKQFHARWNTTMKKAAPIAARAVKGALETAVVRYLGQNLHQLLDDGDPKTESNLEEALKAAGGVVGEFLDKELEAQIDAYARAQKSTEDFRKSLTETISALPDGKIPPLFVLVDELDRCRPSYAIALLERVKHLFEVDGIVFVFATNSGQLRNTVAGAYGAGFDGYQYLKRFFTQTYKFPDPTRNDLVSELCSNLNIARMRAPFEDVVSYFQHAVRAYGMTPREIKQVLEIIETVELTWPTEKVPLELSLLLPMAVAYHRTGDPMNAGVEESKGAIPNTFVINWRHPGIRYEHTDPSVYYARSVFSTIAAQWSSLDKASEQHRPSPENYSDQYVYFTFRPELSVPFNPNAASILSMLPRLVASAGHLRDDEVERGIAPIGTEMIGE